MHGPVVGAFWGTIGDSAHLLKWEPQIMKGFWKNPEETSETLEDGWLHAGDIVFMDDEDYFHFVGRTKDMIKYKGHGVFPAELEDLLTQYPAVQECAVITEIPKTPVGKILKRRLREML